MSYRPVDDLRLVEQADLIVYGVVQSVVPAPGHELDATRYELAVSEQFKGDQSSTLVTWQVPGALDDTQDGALIVPGAPRFMPGEPLLLFLTREADGSLRLTQLALGAFRYRMASNGEVLLEPALADLELLGQPGGPERHREGTAYLNWLRQAAVGINAVADYWRGTHLAAEAGSKFLLASTPARWFEFDQGQVVTLFAGPTPQVGVLSGGYDDLRQAIEAWNQASGSLIRLAYGGAAGTGSGLSQADGRNQVLFNDPHNDVPGHFDCDQGGVVAMTRWRGGASRVHQGRNYRALTEADVVVQDGVGCLLGQSFNMAEVLAHELGHALGLDHPCGEAGLIACILDGRLDQALMRPVMHADGRGAALSADDLAGAAYLYADPSAPIDVPAIEADSGGGALDARLCLILLALFCARAARPRRQLMERPAARPGIACGLLSRN